MPHPGTVRSARCPPLQGSLPRGLLGDGPPNPPIRAPRAHISKDVTGARTRVWRAHFGARHTWSGRDRPSLCYRTTTVVAPLSQIRNARPAAPLPPALPFGPRPPWAPGDGHAEPASWHSPRAPPEPTPPTGAAGPPEPPEPPAALDWEPPEMPCGPCAGVEECDGGSTGATTGTATTTTATGATATGAVGGLTAGLGPAAAAVAALAAGTTGGACATRATGVAAGEDRVGDRGHGRSLGVDGERTAAVGPCGGRAEPTGTTTTTGTTIAARGRWPTHRRHHRHHRHRQRFRCRRPPDSPAQVAPAQWSDVGARSTTREPTPPAVPPPPPPASVAATEDRAAAAAAARTAAAAGHRRPSRRSGIGRKAGATVLTALRDTLAPPQEPGPLPVVRVDRRSSRSRRCSHQAAAPGAWTHHQRPATPAAAVTVESVRVTLEPPIARTP